MQPAQTPRQMLKEKAATLAISSNATIPYETLSWIPLAGKLSNKSHRTLKEAAVETGIEKTRSRLFSRKVAT
jgi:hypothetical protein